MSDYSRNKVVMYPLDNKTLSDLGIKDAWDLEELFPEVAFEFDRQLPYFEIEAMCDDDWNCRYYLSYVLFHSYGEESGEFGRNRPLTPAEQEKYKAIFEKIIPGLDPTKLKYVDYCYYNASESPDFYIKNDDFNDEV